MGTIRKKERSKGIVYEAMVRIKGTPPRSKSFAKRSDAAKWITEIEGKIHKGETISPASVENTTIQTALEDYLDHNSKKDPESGEITWTGISRKKAYSIRVLQNDLGELTLKTFTNKIIGKYIARLLETDVPPPVNRKVIHKLYNGATPKKYSPTSVRKIFYDLKVAVEWWAFENKFNLGDRFERQNVPTNWIPRERRLEDGEEAKLLNACFAMLKAPSQWKNLIGLGLETAMRPSELLKFKWGSVHLEENKRFIGIEKYTNKLKTIRQIPLSRKAIEILKNMRGGDEPNPKKRVFDLIPINGFSAAFKKITSRAGMENFKAHDLRHEALSRLFESNLSLTTMEIAMMSGHSDLKTLSRYLNLRPSIQADKLN